MNPTPSQTISVAALAIAMAWTLGACSSGGETPSDGGPAIDTGAGTGGSGGTPALDTAADRPVDRGADAPDVAPLGPPEVTPSPSPDLGAEAAPPASGYNPCPPAGMPCRILPLGDSITHGIGSTTIGGYRIPLFRKARAANHSLTFVGSVQSGPATVDGVPFPQDHEGHRMFIIDTIGTRTGLAPLVPMAMATHKPHIVLLLIGTNDCSSTTYAPEAPQRLGALIDRIIAADGNALVVVAKIIPNGNAAANQRVATFNNALNAVVATRAAAQKHVVLVDMFQPFVSQPNYQTTLMSDSLHPNDAGFEKMGDVWWAVVGPLLR